MASNNRKKNIEGKKKKKKRVDRKEKYTVCTDDGVDPENVG